jgi:hypothetical protein
MIRPFAVTTAVLGAAARTVIGDTGIRAADPLVAGGATSSFLGARPREADTSSVR